MEEILGRKIDQKSFARQSRDVDIGTADKNDKVSKLFVPLAVSPLSVKTYFCRFQSRSSSVRDSFEFFLELQSRSRINYVSKCKKKKKGKFFLNCNHDIANRKSDNEYISYNYSPSQKRVF